MSWMMPTLVGALVTAFLTALGFFAWSAYMKPRVFRYLFQPVLLGSLAVGVLGLGFAFGTLAQKTESENATREVYSKCRDAMLQATRERVPGQPVDEELFQTAYDACVRADIWPALFGWSFVLGLVAFLLASGVALLSLLLAKAADHFVKQDELSQAIESLIAPEASASKQADSRGQREIPKSRRRRDKRSLESDEG
jgi:hypothetical protein